MLKCNNSLMNQIGQMLNRNQEDRKYNSKIRMKEITNKTKSKPENRAPNRINQMKMNSRKASSNSPQ